tara:strand:- start:749 stop:973 length:225 start_codon:yes stop_codon:yes gene_type:complete
MTIQTNLMSLSGPSLINPMNDQKLSATIYKQLFTDLEWSTIERALADYADYGDEEARITDQINTKISAIYRLTS